MCEPGDLLNTANSSYQAAIVILRDFDSCHGMPVKDQIHHARSIIDRLQAPLRKIADIETQLSQLRQRFQSESLTPQLKAAFVESASQLSELIGRIDEVRTLLQASGELLRPEIDGLRQATHVSSAYMKHM